MGIVPFYVAVKGKEKMSKLQIFGGFSLEMVGIPLFYYFHLCIKH